MMSNSSSKRIVREDLRTEARSHAINNYRYERRKKPTKRGRAEERAQRKWHGIRQGGGSTLSNETG